MSKKDFLSLAPVLWGIPSNLYAGELSGLYGSHLLKEMGEIIKYYQIYEEGAEFNPEGSNGDYVPSEIQYTKAARLVNKEARFLFSRKPDVFVELTPQGEGESSLEQAKKAQSLYQKYVNKVFTQEKLHSKLLKAAKDCFIGKRVAWSLNFDEINKRISLDFIPSLEFIPTYSEENPDELEKLTLFYNLNDCENSLDQRIYKKRFSIQNGKCYLYEAIFDGVGNLVEEITPERATKFPYIPAGVILNDGLTGDVSGQSDIGRLCKYESSYSQLANSDIDAERKSMNPIIYGLDLNPSTTTGLSTAPGSFWDLSTDIQGIDGAKGSVGILQANFGYSEALNKTLGRMDEAMYEELDIPNLSLESMAGVITSGKALKALYWPLMVRCDEKMLSWKPALQEMVKTLIDATKFYPGATAPYGGTGLPEYEYEVKIENLYPLPEDEAEEKTLDMLEVTNNVRSKKSYMMKWGLTSTEADNELKQIATEAQLLENSYGLTPPME